MPEPIQLNVLRERLQRIHAKGETYLLLTHALFEYREHLYDELYADVVPGDRSFYIEQLRKTQKFMNTFGIENDKPNAICPECDRKYDVVSGRADGTTGEQCPFDGELLSWWSE